MFGYVMASLPELPKERQKRYGAVYCGICRQIREHASQLARLGLRYDMAFLALLLMSLYEPDEIRGSHACLVHPLRHFVENEYITYAADMNVALAYYKCMDDYRDEGNVAAKLAAGIFQKDLPRLQQLYPRQCQAIETCLEELSRLEQENCDNPDLPAGCFGRLMGELLVYRQDLWADNLRGLGDALGRFIYLADGAVDYRRDLRKKQYNPFVSMNTGADRQRWEQYLVLEMARCTDYFERLPLVQDKDILDNILYSGVWVEYRRRGPKTRKKEGEHGE